MTLDDRKDSSQTSRLENTDSRWLPAGLFTTGLLVGHLVGLTSESLVTSILGLLFAFVGGSVIGLINRISVLDRKMVGQCLAGFTLAALIGLYAGIVVTEYQLLSPVRVRAMRAGASIEANKYLRDKLVNDADAIDMLYQNKAYSAEKAYAELYRTVKAQDRGSGQ